MIVCMVGRASLFFHKKAVSREMKVFRQDQDKRLKEYQDLIQYAREQSTIPESIFHLPTLGFTETETNIKSLPQNAESIEDLPYIILKENDYVRNKMV